MPAQLLLLLLLPVEPRALWVTQVLVVLVVGLRMAAEQREHPPWRPLLLLGAGRLAAPWHVRLGLLAHGHAARWTC